MAVCFWSLIVVIINSGILDRRISLGNEAIFTSFLLHFQKVQVSRDRLLWMTLKPIVFCEVQLCTGYLLSESDWRLKIKAAGLYVRFGASEFNSKFCNSRSCSSPATLQDWLKLCYLPFTVSVTVLAALIQPVDQCYFDRTTKSVQTPRIVASIV